MNDFMNYKEYSRDEWSKFHGKLLHDIDNDDLKKIKSVDDKVSLEDVQKIFAPIQALIYIYTKNYQQLLEDKFQFLNVKPHKIPFIIGISGSVAVGKSTIARLLKVMLQRAYPQYDIEQITTDGFLYPNSELKKRNIYNDKGFPWSYDNVKLLNFMEAVKANRGPVQYPSYSHEIDDIVPGKVNTVDNPDILIMEGINVLQLPENQHLYVSDYFDFSIYVDADAKLIEKWFIHRFEGFLKLQMQHPDPDNFFYPFTKKSHAANMKFAHQVWQEVNYKNLVEYIEPTMNRADLILHKTNGHLIDKVMLKKY